jgi:hypothetical protein
MDVKEHSLERIESLEKSLGKLARSSATSGSDLSKYKFNIMLKTYMLNINLLYLASGKRYDPKFKEMK